MTGQTITDAAAKAVGSAAPAVGGAPLWVVVAVAVFFHGAGPASEWLRFVRDLLGKLPPTSQSP
jgi:hypothetical protein